MSKLRSPKDIDSFLDEVNLGKKKEKKMENLPLDRHRRKKSELKTMEKVVQKYIIDREQVLGLSRDKAPVIKVDFNQKLRSPVKKSQGNLDLETNQEVVKGL